MPRIRKKTSKRVTLNRRERIKKKVKESRKKKGKEAKKNPQWKSKHAKDPGIPNNFPYKDEILAEVAEQRRLAAEDKQRRKEEKKAAKAQGDAADGSDAGEGEEVAFDGVRALAPQRALEAGSGDRMDVNADEEEVEEDVPVLINPDLPNLKAVLDAADVVVQVLDARDPLASRSAHLEEVVQGLGKRLMLVLNKVDACPKEAVEAWAATLRQDHPTLLFRSATACLPVSSADAVNIKGKGKGKERERADDAWGLDAVVALLRSWAENKQGGDAPLAVAVVGLTNVGKTSFINSLLRKAALETYKLTSTPSDSPTTTTHPQEVTVELEGGHQLRVIDTPGLSWHPTDDASPDDTARIRARDILLRNRGRIERLKDPSSVLSELVSRASREDLMLAYNLPIFTDGDANAFLAGIARANHFIKKKGDPDLAGAARLVLRDWSSGKLARFTLPTSPISTSIPSPSSPSPHSSPAVDPALAEIYATNDPPVLARLRARKELRKASALVKLRPGEVDTRKLVLDASFFLSSDDEGMDGDEEDGGTVDDADEVGLDEESEESYASDEEEEEDEAGSAEDEEDEDEEDELASPPKGKRKRMLAKAPARPAKRVAFAAEPKGTKQARSAAGAKGAAASKAKAKGKEATKVTKKHAKAAVLAKPPKAAAPAAKKIANVASSKKSGATAPAKDGEVAYDFQQFFQ